MIEILSKIQKVFSSMRGRYQITIDRGIRNQLDKLVIKSEKKNKKIEILLFR